MAGPGVGPGCVSITAGLPISAAMAAALGRQAATVQGGKMEERAEAELQEQMEIAADAIRTAALELLQAGRVHPHVLVLAGGIPVEAVLDDLAEVVRDTGQDHAE